MLDRWIALIFICLQITQAILSSDFNVRHYVQRHTSDLPFQPLSLRKTAQKKEIADFATSWFYELLTRLELVTSSLPRKCSTTELQQRSPWKSAVSRSTKRKFQHCVQHCVQQSLPAIACRLMIKWFINREFMEWKMKEDKPCKRGIFKTPLQSLSSLSVEKNALKNFSPPPCSLLLRMLCCFCFCV